MTYVPQINRRAFVASGAALGGGFALGMELPFSANVVRAAEGAPEVTAWVVIKPDDSVVS
jgi:isoquinoline 1-oxidoreductase beta subunit